MWKTSVKDIAGEVLCVSQFTLLANTTKGSKPDFHKAMVRPAASLYSSSFLANLVCVDSPRGRPVSFTACF